MIHPEFTFTKICWCNLLKAIKWSLKVIILCFFTLSCFFLPVLASSLVNGLSWLATCALISSSIQLSCLYHTREKDLCCEVCPSNRPCQTLWVNPASSRNLRLILLVSHSQSVSRLNLRGSHYTSFRLADLLRSQYVILISYRCQQVCIYIHVNVYVLLGIYPVFAQLLFPMLKFFSRPMKCEEIYVFSPYINTIFYHRVYKWPGKQTTMSSHYSNELSRARCWLLHQSV